MSESEPLHPPDYAPDTSIEPVILDLIAAPALAGPSANECLKACLIRTAYDIPPTTIPADLQAIKFDGLSCGFAAESGAACDFANPMVFIKKNLGLVSMGSRNLCSLELDSRREFRKAALGSMRTRVARFSRDVLASARQKWAK